MRTLAALAAILVPLAAHGDPPRRASRVAAAQTLAVGGVVALAGGFALGLVAKHQYDGAFDNGDCVSTSLARACSANGLATARSAMAVGNVGTGIAAAGVAMLAAGAIVYLTAPRERVAVTPVVTPSAAGAALTVRW